MEGRIRHLFCRNIVSYCESIDLLVYLDEFPECSYIGHNNEDDLSINSAGGIHLIADNYLIIKRLNLSDPDVISKVKQHFLAIKSAQ